MRGCSQKIFSDPPRLEVFPAYAGMFRRGANGGGLWGCFPAYAGMFLARSHGESTQNRFPRVCGDVPLLVIFWDFALVFSPRMRGCSGNA